MRGRGERRLLAAIATVQVICTVALLARAALLIRTAGSLARVRPGYETERVLAVTVTNVTPGTSTQFHTAEPESHNYRSGTAVRGFCGYNRAC